MSKKVIIFGPWVGEFSYELSWWNPECRKVKNDNFKDYYAVHLGFNGRKVMYSDFIDEYIPHPTELEETLQFPATYGEHINGQDIIPKSFMEHLNEVVSDFKKRGFTEISVHKPKDIPITRERCLEDYPYGDYVHYTVDDDIQRDVVSRINNYFNNDNPTIFLMARTRTRHGNRCYLDWNPDNWPVFTKRLIEELGVNIISLSIKTQGSRGGSKGLAGHELFTDLQHKIMNFELEKDDSDSFEKQLAILKNTKCSIYGASGAAVVPFFVNTPTFTQQTKEEGYRLELGWERKLMDFKHFKNFDKYHNSEIYDSSVDELFVEFLSFYKEL
tara:strand:- start:593 stop:1579 length:987 start_codon:yes stop_codon:yes gene_type:complete